MTSVDQDQQVDLAALGERLRDLAARAELARIDSAWLEETFRMIGAAHRELDRRRQGDYDPRRVRALARGRRMDAARRAGASIAEIAAAFNCRRSTVYRSLNAVRRSLETVSVLNLPESARTREGGT
jgi:DNA invertase Pin-like site-specific DNA recombinase